MKFEWHSIASTAAACTTFDADAVKPTMTDVISTFHPAFLGVQQVIRESHTSHSLEISRTIPLATLSHSNFHTFPAASKIGIGLGVPFAVILSVVLGLLLYNFRMWQQRRFSPSPAEEGPQDNTNRDTPPSALPETFNELENNDDRHEIHDTGKLAYTTELPGSPGARRAELPTERL